MIVLKQEGERNVGAKFKPVHFDVHVVVSEFGVEAVIQTILPDRILVSQVGPHSSLEECMNAVRSTVEAKLEWSADHTAILHGRAFR